ncbi:MAG: PfkB family carbohydrate kinase, partial [Leisingera sp.]
LIRLTLGGNGAEAHLCPGATGRAEAVPVESADTVGAGDTCNAGFLAKAQELGVLQAAAAGAISTKGLETCLKHAVQAAAVTVARPGANPPWRDELPD